MNSNGLWSRTRQQGVLTVLVGDEAQSLPDDLLEEVRLLANIETDTEKLLHVVLAGQPALGGRLNEPGFRQLKQRIGVRCVLPPLDLRETAVYIAHRISLAGGNPGHVFSREAVIAIYERSGGIPRTINVICENALLTGYAADQRPVGQDIVLEVCRDFDLEGSSNRSVAAQRGAGRASGTNPAVYESTKRAMGHAAGAAVAAAAGGHRFSLSYFATRRQ